MEAKDVEYLFSLSVRNNPADIQRAETMLLEFINSPDSIILLIQIIQTSTNDFFLKASFLYLEKAISIQWLNFPPEQKLNLQSTILNLYFHYQKFRKRLIYLLHFFLKKSDNVDAFLPFLTIPFNQENMFDLIIFYSSVIKFLPREFLESQKDYIFGLSFQCFNLSKNLPENFPSINDIKISIFHVSAVSALLFDDYSIIECEIECISQLLNKAVSTSEISIIFELFKNLIPKLAENQQIQQYFYNVAISTSENANLDPYCRSAALNSIMFQIENGLLTAEQIFHIIDISFDILIKNFESSTTQYQFDMSDILRKASNVISEEDLFSYLFSIEEKAIRNQSSIVVCAGISLICILMDCCPNSFIQHEEIEAKILCSFLNQSFPEEIQTAVLIALCQANENYKSFPIIFPQMLLPFIFDSPSADVSHYACSAIFRFASISTFNSADFFNVLWANREEFMKKQPEYLMEILFHCATLIDEIEPEIQSELTNLVLFYLNPETDFNLLSATLWLSVSLLTFSEQPNNEILCRIYAIIDSSLNPENYNLFKTVMRFIYIFIEQLGYNSFNLLSKYVNQLIEIITNVDMEVTLFVGAAMVKYWNCQQIMPVVYHRIKSYMAKYNLLFNSDVEVEDVEIDDEIENSLVSDYFHYFKILSFLVKYLEADELNNLFKALLENLFLYYHDILPVIEEIFKIAHPENYNAFSSYYFMLANQSLTNKDYKILNFVYTLSSEVFSWDFDEAPQVISEFIEHLKTAMNDPEISVYHKDSFVGIFTDVVLYDKINGEQIVDLFMLIYSLAFQNPPQYMWQNISYFINTALKKIPQVLKLENVANSLGGFIQILLFWLNSPPENEFDMSDTRDNAASLLLSIIALNGINNEQLLEISLAFFPPNDIEEVPAMAKRLIEISQNRLAGYSLRSFALIAAAIVRLVTLGVKKKRKVSIDDELFNSLMMTLKQLLANEALSAEVRSMFQDSPDKIEYLDNLP